ncbi:MAG: hypothetical protein WBB74_02435 [Gaiellaceae bacterium]
MRRVFPVTLVLIGALADHAGAAGLAFDAMLVAAPAAAIATLGGMGDYVEGRAGRVPVGFWSLALALIVTGAAVRAPAVAEGVVPAVAQTALLGCLAVFVAQAVFGVVTELRTVRRLPRP